MTVAFPGMADEDTSLVGREEELSRLRGLVASPYTESRVLLLLGDPGMGKTVLLAEAARGARSASLCLSVNVPAVAYTSIMGMAESFLLWHGHQHLAAHRGDGIRIMTAPAAGSGAVNVRIPRRRHAGEHDA